MSRLPLSPGTGSTAPGTLLRPAARKTPAPLPLAADNRNTTANLNMASLNTGNPNTASPRMGNRNTDNPNTDSPQADHPASVSFRRPTSRGSSRCARYAWANSSTGRSVRCAPTRGSCSD